VKKHLFYLLDRAPLNAVRDNWLHYIPDTNSDQKSHIIPSGVTSVHTCFLILHSHCFNTGGIFKPDEKGRYGIVIVKNKSFGVKGHCFLEGRISK